MVFSETEAYVHRKRRSTDVIRRFEEGQEMMEEAKVFEIVEKFYSSISEGFPFVRIQSYKDLLKKDRYKEIARSMTVPPYPYHDLKSQVELTWAFEDEDADLLTHSVLITANSKTREIVVSGDKVEVLSEEVWCSKGILSEKIKDAFNDPKRSKT